MTAMRGNRKHGSRYCDCCNLWNPLNRTQEKREFQKEVSEELESLNLEAHLKAEVI
jgi:hypothetical protein